jgi:hypothetical protein
VEHGLQEACLEEARLEEHGLKEAWLEKACLEEDGLKEGCLKEAASRGRGTGGWGGGGLLLLTPPFRLHYSLLDPLKMVPLAAIDVFRFVISGLVQSLLDPGRVEFGNYGGSLCLYEN